MFLRGFSRCAGGTVVPPPLLARARCGVVRRRRGATTALPGGDLREPVRRGSTVLRLNEGAVVYRTDAGGPAHKAVPVSDVFPGSGVARSCPAACLGPNFKETGEIFSWVSAPQPPGASAVRRNASVGVWAVVLEEHAAMCAALTVQRRLGCAETPAVVTRGFRVTLLRAPGADGMAKKEEEEEEEVAVKGGAQKKKAKTQQTRTKEHFVRSLTQHISDDSQHVTVLAEVVDPLHEFCGAGDDGPEPSPQVLVRAAVDVLVLRAEQSVAACRGEFGLLTPPRT